MRTSHLSCLLIMLSTVFCCDAYRTLVARMWNVARQHQGFEALLAIIPSHRATLSGCIFCAVLPLPLRSLGDDALS